MMEVATSLGKHSQRPSPRPLLHVRRALWETPSSGAGQVWPPQQLLDALTDRQPSPNAVPSLGLGAGRGQGRQLDPALSTFHSSQSRGCVGSPHCQERLSRPFSFVLFLRASCY
jgi:hypothetical protein